LLRTEATEGTDPSVPTVNPEAWLGLATVLMLGATSPGPSLAYVLRNTINGGRVAGLASALGHGLGMGCYAFLFAVVLSAALQASPEVEAPLRMVGALLLVGIGAAFLRAGFAPRPNSDRRDDLEEESEDDDGEQPGRVAARERPEVGLAEHRLGRNFGFGFALAFFNPKIAAFLLAVYSQFVEADAGLPTQVGMAALAFVIDAGWYAVVAVLLSGGIGVSLSDHGRRIDQVIGAVMLLFGFSVLF